MIYLVEMVAAIDAAGTTTTLRATTAAHYATGPTDTPANTQYLPRVKTAGLFRRDIASPGRIYGATPAGYGMVELANADGALDGWLDYGFDGRAITLKAGEDGAPYADMVTVLLGTMDQVQADGLGTLTVRIRDRLHELDKPLLSATYTGGNSLPAGLEGVEDLAGKRKPRVYGAAANVSPPCVNTSRLIYQVSDIACYSVTAIYDQGVSLTKGADYTSQSDMETTAPSAGQARVWPAGGYFRLGSSPAGQVTADVWEYSGTPGTDPGKAAYLLQEIAEDSGIATADISAADVTALNALAVFYTPHFGIYLEPDAPTTALQAMDLIANGCQVWYGFDRLGKLRMQRMSAPSLGDSVYTFGAHEVLSLRRRASDDAGAGVPAWSVAYRYFPNYTVQRDSDLAGSVTLVNRQYKREEWRSAKSTDAAIKTKHLLAQEIGFDCYVAAQPTAATFAADLLALLKVERALYEVKVHLRLSMISLIELGAVVRLDIDRFGLLDKPLRITGILHDPRAQTAELTLWG
jgi:hypothetical protein